MFVENKKGGVRFGMKTVEQAYLANARIRSLITQKHIFPTDKMDMEPVRKITDPDKEDERAIGYYLSQVHHYYQ